MKVQFGATCFISVFKRDEKSRKFKQVLSNHKARGCVLTGEPRSLTIGNDKNPQILVYLEPYQHYSLESSKEVAYLQIVGNFLADY